MNKAKQEKICTAALIVIGNEILSGRTQDANTPWIGEKLGARGIRLMEVRVVPDVESRIVAAVRALKGAYDYVFTTGGIGPTHDDITAASVAAAFGTALEENAEARAMLREHYGEDVLSPARLHMAMIPKGAALILNPVSGAPGFVIENVYVMAGVPRIMRAMLDNILPALKQGAPILSRTVSCDLPESAVADDLGRLQADWPDIEIGSYPYFRDGKLGVSLVMRGTDRAAVDSAADAVAAMVETLGGTAMVTG